ncbi:FecR family protein [Sphingobacterium sp. HMA12]|uniref:FecR family protein n=1 Tax=Sphingobacterium sp. HMA12 TaxID=2050894 RepID=UPI000CEA0474|nr:FecR family protein [Sphingobacterium sp. HMA12]
MEKKNLNKLFQDFIVNRSSAEDIEQLMQHFGSTASTEHLYDLIKEQLTIPQSEQSPQAVESIVGSVDKKIAQTLSTFQEREKKQRKTQKLWRFASAAAILILSILTIFWQYKPNISKNVTQQLVEKHPEEILPGKKQARLTLYNGEKLEFDKQHTVNEKNSAANLNYEEGRLVYSGSSPEEAIQWNMLEVPKAGTFEIQLPDGSTVWVNANSKLYFPNRFPTDQRFVRIEGEAFFKVQKDKKRPFKVQTGDLNISVLGTSFNVRAYNNKHISTTLVEGSVQLTYHDQHIIMTPGEKAFIDETNKLKIQTIDIESATAWKEGYFYFKDESLGKILQDISNWYDLKVSIIGNLPSGRYSGSMDRNSKLNGVLKMLANVGNLDFTLNGNHLTVKQKNK